MLTTYPVEQTPSGHWRARGIARWPGTYAVYRLLYRGRVLYVGKSARLPRRIAWHTSARPGLIDAVVVERCEDRDAMDRREAALIHELHPPLNNLCPVCPWPRS